MRGEFGAIADVDDGVAGIARGLEVVEGELEPASAIVPRAAASAAPRRSASSSAPRTRFATDAVRGAARTDAGARERAEVEQQHLVVELAGQVEQQLQRLEGLQAAEHRGHGAEYAGLAAVADHAVLQRIGPDAAQAGAAAIGPHDLQLALVLVDAGEDHGPAGAHGRVVQQELGAEVVGAVDDEVVVLEPAIRVRRIERLHLGRLRRRRPGSARARAPPRPRPCSWPQSASA